MQESLYFETLEMIAATMAHDVKNPLALVQVNVDYLELCDVSKKFTKNYNIIREELRKTNEMLVGFIDMIRVVYQFDEPVPVYDAMTMVLDRHTRGVAPGVALTCVCHDKNLYFKGNLQLFTMALSNVLKNAIEAVGEQGTITMTATQNEGMLTVTVADDGGGIPAHILAQIDQNKSCTTKEFGTGVGIDVCKKIMAEHKGTYAIDSVSGVGCTVTMRVPLAT